MGTSIDSPPRFAEPEPEEPTPSSRRRGRAALLAGAGVFVAMIVYWALVFTGSLTPHNPDRLPDRAWATRTEAICTPYYNAVYKLPNAGSAKDGTQRAESLDRGTVLVKEMVAKLATDMPNSADGQKTVREWLADWQLYIADRDAYAAKLRQPNSKAEPLFTIVHGSNTKQVITDFADANSMYNCEPPVDM